MWELHGKKMEQLAASKKRKRKENGVAWNIFTHVCTF
jgi:hypothetical protein